MVANGEVPRTRPNGRLGQLEDINQPPVALEVDFNCARQGQLVDPVHFCCAHDSVATQLVEAFHVVLGISAALGVLVWFSVVVGSVDRLDVVDDAAVVLDFLFSVAGRCAL